MSRYICIDDICIPSDENDWEELVTFADAIAEQEPIEIIRCRDCKYWVSDGGALMICDIHKDPTVPEHFCSYGERNSSEKPNNCEHITEDGVTCAKYPACNDCPDNPLSKVKGSERLVKGLEKFTDCRTCKWWSIYGYCVHRECKGYEPQTEREGE